MPKFILHDSFIGVLEDGHVMQPDPVLWNSRPTQNKHTHDDITGRNTPVEGFEIFHRLFGLAANLIANNYG